MANKSGLKSLCIQQHAHPVRRQIAIVGSRLRRIQSPTLDVSSCGNCSERSYQFETQSESGAMECTTNGRMDHALSVKCNRRPHTNACTHTNCCNTARHSTQTFDLAALKHTRGNQYIYKSVTGAVQKRCSEGVQKGHRSAATSAAFCL